MNGFQAVAGKLRDLVIPQGPLDETMNGVAFYETLIGAEVVVFSCLQSVRSDVEAVEDAGERMRMREVLSAAALPESGETVLRIEGHAAEVLWMLHSYAESIEVRPAAGFDKPAVVLLSLVGDEHGRCIIVGHVDEGCEIHVHMYYDMRGALRWLESLPFVDEAARRSIEGVIQSYRLPEDASLPAVVLCGFAAHYFTLCIGLPDELAEPQDTIEFTEFEA